MNQKLFEILTDDELKLLKEFGLARNVYLKDLSLEELFSLRQIFWPDNYKLTSLNDVLKQLQNRKAI